MVRWTYLYTGCPSPGALHPGLSPAPQVGVPHRVFTPRGSRTVLGTLYLGTGPPFEYTLPGLLRPSLAPATVFFLHGDISFFLLVASF